jgi:hypothetical protein
LTTGDKGTDGLRGTDRNDREFFFALGNEEKNQNITYISNPRVHTPFVATGACPFSVNLIVLALASVAASLVH